MNCRPCCSHCGFSVAVWFCNQYRGSTEQRLSSCRPNSSLTKSSISERSPASNCANCSLLMARIWARSSCGLVDSPIVPHVLKLLYLIEIVQNLMDARILLLWAVHCNHAGLQWRPFGPVTYLGYRSEHVLTVPKRSSQHLFGNSRCLGSPSWVFLFGIFPQLLTQFRGNQFFRHLPAAIA